MKIKAILFDLIGTTVHEDRDTMLKCFEKAFTDHNILLDTNLIRKNRGKDKIEMIHTVLEKGNYPKSLAPEIYHSMKENVTANLENFKTKDGAMDLFNYLERRNILMGVGTGLSRDLFESIITHLQWPVTKFNYIGIGSDLPRQRPHPDMILDMMTKLKITNKELLKVGDTLADIEEGKNANVLTVAILSGTQPDQDLRDAKPDYTISKLSEIKKIIA